MNLLLDDKREEPPGPLPGPPDTRRYDVRFLVCEGAECNPQLKEYDLLVEAYGGGRGNLAFIKEWARGLRHTMHERVGQPINWDSNFGWIRTFRCARCGHVRKF